MDRFKINYLKTFFVLLLCIANYFLQIQNISARRVIRKGNIDSSKSGLRSSTKIRCSGPGDPKCLGTNAPFKNNKPNKPGKITCTNPGDPACLGTDAPFKPTPLKPRPPRTPTTPRLPPKRPPRNSDDKPTPDNGSTPPGNETPPTNGNTTKQSRIPALCPMVLKKACGKALMKKIDLVCSNSQFNGGMADIKNNSGDNSIKVKCYDPTDLLVKFDTSVIEVEVDEKTADTYLPDRDKNKDSITYNEICGSCSEILFTSIADNYAITGENSVNCKRARVIAAGANECFQITLAAGKAYGVSSAIESKLRAACGAGGLNAKWSSMFGETPYNLNFDGDMPDKFMKVGDIGASDSFKLVGNFLDGKYTGKSNTWERELLELTNTYNNQVAGFCGKEYAVSMHNTNIHIIDEKNSLERMVDEKGLLKGTTDWGLEQASVFIGEDKTNKIKKEGMKSKEKDEEKTEGVIEPINIKEGLYDEKVKQTLKGKTEGLYLLHNDKNFRIVEIKQNDGKKVYSTINYEYKMNISKDALKIMIGKTENNELSKENEPL